MSALRAWAPRAGLGLALGGAAGMVIYMFYNPRWKKGFWRKCSEGNRCNQQPPPMHYELQDLPTEPLEALVQREADGATLCSTAACAEQVAVLDRLDFVLQSVAELRQEVAELRDSLQTLSADIVTQVTSHITENQKVSRRRRYVFHRERSDSTGSSSVYFTATPGPATTDGESEGGYTTANPESDYDRGSAIESDEEEDSCETVKMARGDSMELVNDEETTLTFDTPSGSEFAEFRESEKETENKGQESEEKTM